MLRDYFVEIIVLLATLFPATAVASSPVAKAAVDKEAAALRLREGEVIEVTGRLELSGDRAIFHPDGEEVGLRVLENLALERITRVLSESRDERQWIVNGTVTEYRGANYILIHKAVQRAGKPSVAK